MNSVLYRAQEGTGTEAFLGRKRIGKERNRDCLLIHRHRIPCRFSPFSVKFSLEERFGKERKRDCLLIRLHTTPSLPIFFYFSFKLFWEKRVEKERNRELIIHKSPSLLFNTHFFWISRGNLSW